MPSEPIPLLAFTGATLLLGYAIICAVFCAGVRAGRFIERSRRGGW